MRRVVFSLVFVLLTAGHEEPAQVSALIPSTAPQSPISAIVFEDNFEADTGWLVFEEIVGGSACYGGGIGNVARNMDLAFSGSYSLRVWANQAFSTKSNHLIGYRKFSNAGQSGIWRYELRTYIAPETANSGEAGPEFSIQNTRQEPAGEFRTSTAGIQYIANPFSPNYQRWNIWHLGNWIPFITQPLTASQWYTLGLEVDYSANRYRSFSIQGGEFDFETDLSAYQIAKEDKGFMEESFVASLESENLWNNCGTAGAYEYKVYYDRIALMHGMSNVYLPVILK